MSQINVLDQDDLLRNLDVLIALLNNVKLNKENQLELMKGVKEFINNKKTKKKAYKLLALIVEKYQLEDIKEIV